MEHKFDCGVFFPAEESPQQVSDDQDDSISEETEEQHESSTEIRIAVKEEEEEHDKGEKKAPWSKEWVIYLLDYGSFLTSVIEKIRVS